MPTFTEILDNDDDSIPSSISVPDILDHEVSSSILPLSALFTHQTDSNVPNDPTRTAPSLSSTVEKSREALMSEIEDTIEQVFASIAIGESFKLPIKCRPASIRQNQKRKRPPTAMHAPRNDIETISTSNTRYLTLSSSCKSTQALARYLSVLQMIYEAIAHRIMLTKRDMYYRNVELFSKQSVVDIIVDDISRHYNVPRSSLNVSAASKGLVFGPIIIRLKNNKTLDCSFSSATAATTDDGQGILIPPIHQIIQVQCKAKYMIVVEKEATFRYLVSVGFCQSLPESCVLVTGKGYPDLSTRQFVKYFSTHFTTKPILALMDGDPHGLDIYATYKWGTRAMSFDVFNLAVNSIELIGLTCRDRKDFHVSPQCLIPLTERDRAKCLAMVKTYNQNETPGQSQLIERGWQDVDTQLASQGHQSYIREIKCLLQSDHKCEIQALNDNGPFSLTNYLIKKLAKYVQ
ncbi:hypothetical protein [Parasitella parasitica]|uniref:DNA topoisomerase (ATP-hydrolyzing) n=1 Tax=Parasitella parasitica TaxID=35722 RepID=A0A0B7NAN3_9FUNG|nr:hypothetical protein [Parasitella parasitica]